MEFVNAANEAEWIGSRDPARFTIEPTRGAQKSGAEPSQSKGTYDANGNRPNSSSVTPIRFDIESEL